MAIDPVLALDEQWAQSMEDDLTYEQMGRWAANDGPGVKSDMVNDIMRYEAGEMSQAEEVAFFQVLVTSGLAWSLQGSYGRTATDFINAGLVKRP